MARLTIHEKILNQCRPKNFDEYLNDWRWRKGCPPARHPEQFERDDIEWAQNHTEYNFKGFEEEHDMPFEEIVEISPEDYDDPAAKAGFAAYRIFVWLRKHDNGELSRIDLDVLNYFFDILQTANFEHNLRFSHMTQDRVGQMLELLGYPDSTSASFNLHRFIWRARTPNKIFNQINDPQCVPVLKEPFTWFYEAMQPSLAGFVDAMREKFMQESLPRQRGFALMVKVDHPMPLEQPGKPQNPWFSWLEQPSWLSMRQFDVHSRERWKNFFLLDHDEIESKPVTPMYFDNTSNELRFCHTSKWGEYGGGSPAQLMFSVENERLYEHCVFFWIRVVDSDVRLYFSFGKYRLRVRSLRTVNQIVKRFHSESTLDLPDHEVLFGDESFDEQVSRVSEWLRIINSS